MAPDRSSRWLDAVDPDLRGQAVHYVSEQDRQRAGRWPSPRQRPSPGEPPYPAFGNPMFTLLEDMVLRQLRAVSMEQRDALRYALLTAWFEGHIEGYDRALSN